MELNVIVRLTNQTTAQIFRRNHKHKEDEKRVNFINKKNEPKNIDSNTWSIRHHNSTSVLDNIFFQTVRLFVLQTQRFSELTSQRAQFFHELAAAERRTLGNRESWILKQGNINQLTTNGRIESIHARETQLATSTKNS